VSSRASALNGFDLYFMLGRGALTTSQLQTVTRNGGTNARALDFAMAAAGSGDSFTVPSDEVEPEEVVGTDVNEPSGRPAGQSATSCPAPYTMFWDPRDEYRFNHVPTKWFRTLDNSSLRWTFQRTHETTFGIVYDSGSKYQGGVGGARYQSSSLDFKPAVGNNVRKLWKIKVKYRKWRAYCQYFEIELPYGDTYYLDLWKWAPESLTGGSKLIDTSGSITCPDGAAYRDRFGAETTISRGTTATYNNSFGIAGIKLDSTTLDRDYQTFTIIPDQYKNPLFCGSNDRPLYANFTKETTP
jgi:hypothetical protein